MLNGDSQRVFLQFKGDSLYPTPDPGNFYILTNTGNTHVVALNTIIKQDCSAYNEHNHKKQAREPQINIAVKDHNHDKEEKEADTTGKS